MLASLSLNRRWVEKLALIIPSSREDLRESKISMQRSYIGSW